MDELTEENPLIQVLTQKEAALGRLIVELKKMQEKEIALQKNYKQLINDIEQMHKKRLKDEPK